MNNKIGRIVVFLLRTNQITVSDIPFISKKNFCSFIPSETAKNVFQLPKLPLFTEDLSGNARFRLSKQDERDHRTFRDMAINSLTSLTNFPNLTELDFISHPHFTLLSHLKKRTTLTKLNFYDCDRSSRALSHLHLLTQLVGLNILASRKGIDEKRISKLGSLTHLEDFSLYGHLKIENVGFLSKLTRLSALNLSGCPKINRTGLGCITTLTNLFNLKLVESGHVSDALVHSMTTLTRLTHLNLSATGVTNEGISSVAHSLTNLTTIRLEGCNTVTEAGIAQLITNLKLTSSRDQLLREVNMPMLQVIYKDHVDD